MTIAPGPHLLSDILISSPILSADRSSSIPEALGGTGAGPSTATSGANEFEFGVDPSLDPELAMVRLTLSLLYDRLFKLKTFILLFLF